jgi:DNA-binding MarR family transcriptional regulator
MCRRRSSAPTAPSQTEMLTPVDRSCRCAIATTVHRQPGDLGEGNALAVIEGNGGPLPTTEISARMHITEGTMTTVLDTLERKQLVHRSVDPSDRRRVLIDITPPAQDLLNEMLPEVQQVSALLMARLTDREKQELLTILAGVRAALTEPREDLPPAAPRNAPRPLRRHP